VFGVIKGKMTASGDENEGVILGNVRTAIRRLRRLFVLWKRVITKSLKSF
jgi:hypothetical protein